MTRSIFEKSQKGQRAWSLAKEQSVFSEFQPDQNLVRKEPLGLPEISEIDLMRHFSKLAHRNMSIDTHFYPLGSCTMKLNPRVNEWCAALPGFAKTHPLAPVDSIQGNLQIIYEFNQILCRLTGMAAGTLVPNAGAQGELTGVLMMAAYHRKKGDFDRTEMLIPDNAHGTNPATAAMAGFKTVSLPTNQHGDIDLEVLRSHLSARTAGLMLTNPNTLGLFSPQIHQIAQLVHEAGGLLYYDGANLNPILNVTRPGEMGFDVMHLNLHKTFSTPHGGGGPGSGPVLCNERLREFLPLPQIVKEGDHYEVRWENGNSIGLIATFYGNFAIYLRAFLYAKLHGDYGLRRIAEISVLNANYLKTLIGRFLKVPFARTCMHEFVVQADQFSHLGVKALDIAKRLLDYGVHAPTIYFPLIIKECMLIEPTESESKMTLDEFVDILKKIVQEIEECPEYVKTAPHSMSVSRLDEVRAIKQPILKHLS